MSRYLRDLSRCLLAVALFAPPAALATEYTIEEVSDSDPDAVCSLVEAFAAISTQAATGGCAAGTGGDTIYLPEGETLQLTAELELGGGEKNVGTEDDPDMRPITPAVLLRVGKDGPFDNEDKVNATLRAADGARVISVKDGARLTVQGVDLAGGDPALGVAGNGGLIHTEGQVTLSGLRLAGGRSQAAGGAIWLAAEAPSLSLSEVLAEDNTANDGGVIAVGPDFEGILQINGSVFTGNSATQGSALYIASAQPSHVSRARVGILNSTLYNHAAPGSAVVHVADISTLLVNNVTMAGNGLPAFFFDAAIHNAAEVAVRNSVLVGNQGGSCTPAGFDSASGASWTFAYVLSEGSCPLDHDAWMRDPNDNSIVVQNNSDTADLTVLRGFVNDSDPTLQITSGVVEAECADVAGEDYCLPLCLRTESKTRTYTTAAECMAEGGTLGFMPAYRNTFPLALNAGSPDGSTEFSCRSTDQRGITRPVNCDAGSVEFIVAQGVPDEFDVVIDVESELDVLRNALGDAVIDSACGLPYLGLSVRVPPLKGVARPEVRNGRPVIVYHSDPTAHGVDRFAYSMSAQCIEGPVATLTSLDEIAAPVNVVVAPERGIKSESIGSAGVLSLVLVSFCGLARRRRSASACAVVAAIVLPLHANAAEIWVNSIADQWPAVIGDGECTLREAYNTAINNSPNPSPDCNNGSRGADTIRFRDDARGVICLEAPLNNVLASGDSPGGVEIIGLGADTSTTGEFYTVIDGGRAANTECSGNGGSQLIIAGSSLTVRNATLRNGNAANHGGAIVALGPLTLDGVVLTDNQATANGGAVYLGYTGDLRRNVKITDSEFSNNSAGGHGGALSMLGQEQEYSLLIDRSAFLDNAAGGTGGALDVNLAKGSVAITNTTFDNNTASGADEEFGTSADAVDVAGVPAGTGARVSIINTTFNNHPTRAIDMRAGANVDSSADGSLIAPELVIPVAISNSVWLNSGGCSSSSGQLYQRGYNVFAPYDVSCTAFSGEQDSDGNPTNEDTVPASTLAEVFPTRTTFTRTDEDATPSHYPIDDAQVAGHAGLAAVLNAGREGDHYSGETNPLHCRTSDVRDYARTAGGRCDRGAHELPALTAVDDESGNAGRRDRSVVVDVLANDNPGDSSEEDLKVAELCLTDDPSDACTAPVTSLTLAGGATVRTVVKTSPQYDCGTVQDNDGEDIEKPDECVVRYEPPSPLTCDALKNFSDTFSYRFRTDPAGDWSTSASVDVVVRNVSPRGEEVIVSSSPGEIVVLPFVVDDPDGSNPPALTDIELTAKPINARYVLVDGEPVYLGTGVVVDVAAQTVTYYPHNVLSPFDERFTVSYKDECGGQGSTAFRIKYPDSDASGDLAGGGGSLAWWALIGLSLLGLRRRA